MAPAQKEPWKHHSIPPACPVHKQGTFEVTVTVPSLHRAEIHLYATTVRPHWPSRAWIEKGQMSSYLCPETWLIHHSWLQTLWVSPAQSCRTVSQLLIWQPWHFLVQSQQGPNEYPRRSWRAQGLLKWHCEIWVFEPLPRSMQPQQSQGQFGSGRTYMNTGCISASQNFRQCLSVSGLLIFFFFSKNSLTQSQHVAQARLEFFQFCLNVFSAELAVQL